LIGVMREGLFDTRHHFRSTELLHSAVLTEFSGKSSKRSCFFNNTVLNLTN